MIPGWHPIIIHFAVALTVTSAFALLAARFIPSDVLARATAVLGTWNLCLGTGFCLVAIATGIAAVWNLHLIGAARQAVSLHVKWAFFTTLALILLSVWRGAGVAADSRPSNLFLVVLFGAVCAVTVTAYLGGENVYRFGIGVLVR